MLQAETCDQEYRTLSYPMPISFPTGTMAGSFVDKDDANILVSSH